MSVSLIDGHIDDDVMTDEQIIKALEYCVEKGYCTDCPYNESFSDCKVEYDILDLINRKRAKLEALQMDNAQLQSDIVNANMNADHALAEIERLNKQLVFEIKSAYDRGTKAAVKEFAERLKEKAHRCDLSTDEHEYYSVGVFEIDNLVKEMVGES